MNAYARSATATLLCLCGCRDFKLGTPVLYPASHTCQAADECGSDLCIEGFCCERACAADELCTLPGFQGYCTPRPPGTACERAEQCPDHRCLHALDADGQPVSFCCEAECAADQVCDVPGHEGHCTPRPNGAKCSTKDQCPSGFCADGVCCASACTETCHSCSTGAVKGVCDFAPANTDARKECGQCGACLRGWCGPADVGSDPNGKCGPGKVCGAGQSCGLPGEASCAADVDCAVGACVMSRCLQTSTERIWLEPMVDVPTVISTRGLAMDSQGQLAVNVAEFIQTDGNSEQYLHVLVRHATGAWTSALEVTVRFQGTGGVLNDTAASLTFWNDRLFVALFQPSTGPLPRGLYGRLFSSSFQPGPPEPLVPFPTSPGGLALMVDAENRIVADVWSYQAGYTFQLQRREKHDESAPTWSLLTPSPVSTPSFDVAMLSGKPVVATLSEFDSKIAVRWLDQTAPAAEAVVPASCDEPLGVYAAPWEGEQDAGLVLTVPCYSSTTVAIWRPGSGLAFEDLPFLSALGVAGAKAPLLTALAYNSDPSLLDGALAWLGADGKWVWKVVLPSRGTRYVKSLRGVLGPQGFPVLVAGSAAGASDYQTRLDLVRLQP